MLCKFTYLNPGIHTGHIGAFNKWGRGGEVELIWNLSVYYNNEKLRFIVW